MEGWLAKAWQGKLAFAITRRHVKNYRSPVAQLVERVAVNHHVAGSSPARGASSQVHRDPRIPENHLKAPDFRGFFFPHDSCVFPSVPVPSPH